MTHNAEAMTTEVREYALGDRVVRRTNVHDRTSRLMHGEIVNVRQDDRYRDDSRYGLVYTVAWDHNRETPASGYFWWGLDYERTSDE